VLACLMHFRFAVRFSVLIALLGVAAVPADALAAGAVRTSSVTARAVVPAGGASTIRLRCPSSTVALNGAITRRGSGVVVRRSNPGADPDSWAFRVAASGSGSRSVTAMLRCVRVEIPARLGVTRLHVRTRMHPVLPVPAGGTASVALGCGSAWSGTGYGFAADARNSVRIASVVPTAHGWRFTLENTGGSAARAGVSIRCLRTRVATSRGARLDFRVARRAATRTVGPGPAQTFSRSCGRGFSLATGSTVDPADPIELALSSPLGRSGGHWTFSQANAGDRVESFLVCLSRATRFR
jgi:hypothetical protein